MAITVQMRTQVSQLYVALFGRAPDGDGLAFWVGRLDTLGGTAAAMTQIANDMFATAPARAYFPLFLTNREIISSFYVNVLGRAADTGGLDFWTAKLDARGATPGSVITEMIGAVVSFPSSGSADGVASRDLFNNKVTVAQAYGEKNLGVTYATSILQDVTKEAATVTAAVNLINTNNGAPIGTGGQTFRLTTGVDSGAAFTGGAGADTFNAPLDGAVATLNNLDALNGGQGTDTLNAVLNGVVVTPAALTSIETININSTAAGSALDLSNSTGLQSVVSSASAGSLALNNIQSTAVNFTIAGTAQAHALNFAGSAVSGAADVVRVSTNNFGATLDAIADLTVSAGVETLALSVTGVNTIDSDFAGAITVAGAGSLELTGVAGNVLSTNIDASTNSGGITVVTANTATVSGGSGNDTITIGGAGAARVSGGAGNDTFNFGADLTAADTLAGGDGTDSLTVTATVNDAGFTNVTSIENLTLAAGASTLGSAAQTAGVVTVNASAGATSMTATAYTVGLAVTLGANADNIATGTGNDAFTGSDGVFTAGDTIAAGTGTDTIRITGASSTATLDFDNITGIEQVVAVGTTAADAVAIQIDSIASTVATTIAIDASGLTGASDTLSIGTHGATTATTAFSITGAAGGDTINANDGADTISGGAGNDSIVAGAGNDVVNAGDGNDTVNTGTGADSVAGGEGNDTIIAGASLTATDTLAGGNGTDTLSITGAFGTGGDALFANVTSIETLVFTASGATTIGTSAQAAGITTLDLSLVNGGTGGTGTFSATGFTVGLAVTMGPVSDSISTGSGNDVFSGGSNNIFDGGETIAAGSGTDTIRVTGSSATATIDFDTVTGIEEVVAAATTGTDSLIFQFNAVTSTVSQTITVNGAALTGVSDSLTVTNNAASTTTRFNITGGAAVDTLAGSNGADTISGGTGADSLVGNSGADSILGGAGNDSLNGGAGNDILSGEDGDDSITAGADFDQIDGGVGNDLIIFGSNFTFDDTVRGGDGTDSLSADALTTDGDIKFLQVSSVETLVLGLGASTIGARAQAAGVTSVDLSAAGGASSLVASGFTVGLSVTLGATGDNVTTGNGDDTFSGSTGVFTAGDTIAAGTGTDTIRITGGSSTATLDFDSITGIEQVVAAGTTGTDAVAITFDAVTATTAQTITVSGAALTGVSDTLAITNNAASTTTRFNITGAAAGDTLAASDGADTIDGGTGDDNIVGNGGNDSIVGGAGADTINAGAGNDTVSGGDGADTITGGVGLDRLTGGDGADRFVAGTEATSLIYDTITDLTVGDIIGLNTAGAGTETFTSAAISLGGNATFQDYLNAGTATTGTQGEISWFQFNGNTYVVQDNNAATSFVAGGSDGDIVVEIVGLVNLAGSTAGDGQITYA